MRQAAAEHEEGIKALPRAEYLSHGGSEFVAYREVPAKVMMIETSPPLTNNSTAEGNIVENQQRPDGGNPRPARLRFERDFF